MDGMFATIRFSNEAQIRPNRERRHAAKSTCPRLDFRRYHGGELWVKWMRKQTSGSAKLNATVGKYVGHNRKT